jgi:hypothetical protein
MDNAQQTEAVFAPLRIAVVPVRCSFTDATFIQSLLPDASQAIKSQMYMGTRTEQTYEE